MMVFHTSFEKILDLRMPQKEGNLKNAIGHFFLKEEAAFRY
jgi:hypothetical protein